VNCDRRAPDPSKNPVRSAPETGPPSTPAPALCNAFFRRVAMEALRKRCLRHLVRDSARRRLPFDKLLQSPVQTMRHPTRKARASTWCRIAQGRTRDLRRSTEIEARREFRATARLQVRGPTGRPKFARCTVSKRQTSLDEQVLKHRYAVRLISVAVIAHRPTSAWRCAGYRLPSTVI
jgi:hypothetical protein